MKSNYLEFPFIFYAVILHFEIKFGIQIYQKISRSSSVLSTIKPFLKEYMYVLWTCLQFLYIFCAEVAHTENTFFAQICHKNTNGVSMSSDLVQR